MLLRPEHLKLWQMLSPCGSVCSLTRTATRTASRPPSRPWRMLWMTQVIHAHAACTEAAPPDRGPAALARSTEVVDVTKRAPPAARCAQGPAGQPGTWPPWLRPRGTCVGALISSLRQELTPARLRGRVESAYLFIESGAAAPGALVSGLLAAQLGLTAPFWLGGLIGLFLMVSAWPTFSAATVDSARRAITVGDRTTEFRSVCHATLRTSATRSMGSVLSSSSDRRRTSLREGHTPTPTSPCMPSVSEISPPWWRSFPQHAR